MFTQWRVHPSLPHYEVSYWGAVRRATNSKTRKKGHIVKGNLHPKGYIRYKLVDTNGNKIQRGAHQLVLETFCGPAPSAKHQGAHNNGKPYNNFHMNLRWATDAENKADVVIHGTQKGTCNGRAKLTEDLVRQLRKEYIPHYGAIALLARKYDIGWTAIKEALTGNHWGHV